MKRMRRRAKPPSCSRGLLPLTAIRFSSPSSAATLKAALREAQLEPDDTYRRFDSHWQSRSEDEAAADAAWAELIAKSRDIAAYQIAGGLRLSQGDGQGFRMVANFLRYS